MIRTTRALSGEREKRGDIAGTAGPPEIFRDPIFSKYVVGPSNVSAEMSSMHDGRKKHLQILLAVVIERVNAR